MLFLDAANALEQATRKVAKALDDHRWLIVVGIEFALIEHHGVTGLINHASRYFDFIAVVVDQGGVV
jgi:hypothetical protein